jgi:uncharacterized protein
MDSAALAKEPFVSITTFKRDGTPVSVPVWCAADNGTLLVFSEADSWKVKRIRRDPHVRLGPCSARGRPRGPAVDADASLVKETATVEALLARKYGWAWRGYRALQGQLFGFLDGDDPLPWRDLAGDRVQGGGLARPGPPGAEQVEAGPHRRLQQPGNLPGEGAQGEQVLDGVGQEAVAADGQAGEGSQGWADGVQAAAVGQAGIGLGVGLIQPPSGHRDRTGGERPQLRLGPEPGADAFLGAAAAQHERPLVAIDQQLLHILITSPGNSRG